MAGTVGLLPKPLLGRVCHVFCPGDCGHRGLRGGRDLDGAAEKTSEVIQKAAAEHFSSSAAFLSSVEGKKVSLDKFEK